MDNLINPTAKQFAYMTGLSMEDSQTLITDANEFAIRFEAPNGDFRVANIYGHIALVAVDYTEAETEYTV